ncbi:MAG: hypothetical protein M1824_004396 [Vezdaea acicularis]|nr:MAG: hypothetical protein M1824_004396 [Vezdaea acicularis]
MTIPSGTPAPSIDCDSDSEWEYEYSPTETESIYAIIDLGVSGVPEPRRQRSKVPPAAEPDERTFQVLDLHTKNPIVACNNKLFSCHWAEPIGSTLVFDASGGNGDGDSSSPSLLPHLTTSPLRLVCTPATLIPKVDSRVERSSIAISYLKSATEFNAFNYVHELSPSSLTQASSPDTATNNIEAAGGSPDRTTSTENPERADNTADANHDDRIPLSATFNSTPPVKAKPYRDKIPVPPGTSVQRKRQALFLERLQAIKRKRGEKDDVTIFATKRIKENLRTKKDAAWVEFLGEGGDDDEEDGGEDGEEDELGGGGREEDEEGEEQGEEEVEDRAAPGSAGEPWDAADEIEEPDTAATQSDERLPPPLPANPSLTPAQARTPTSQITPDPAPTVISTTRLPTLARKGIPTTQLKTRLRRQQQQPLLSTTTTLPRVRGPDIAYRRRRGGGAVMDMFADKREKGVVLGEGRVRQMFEGVEGGFGQGAGDRGVVEVDEEEEAGLVRTGDMEMGDVDYGEGDGGGDAVEADDNLNSTAEKP